MLVLFTKIQEILSRTAHRAAQARAQAQSEIHISTLPLGTHLNASRWGETTGSPATCAGSRWRQPARPPTRRVRRASTAGLAKDHHTEIIGVGPCVDLNSFFLTITPPESYSPQTSVPRFHYSSFVIPPPNSALSLH